MVPLCLDQGIGLIPWSPLARGFLAGNRRRDKSGQTTRSRSDSYAHSLYYREEDFDIVERVGELAEKKGHKPMQVALAWLLHKPGVVAPIIGATKMHHLEEAVEALSVEMSSDELSYLEELYQPHPILGHS